MPTPRRRELSVRDYADGVRAGDRAVLGRAISLIESHARRHQDTARELLATLMPHTGGSVRIGITGVPGVGKSTFIERFGLILTEEGRKVAVLAVDPSSGVTGGSILGDKTRMEKLSIEPSAFIRPSPAAGTLGGVASKTRETMLVCEAAGFDAVIIETVGVGQSETVVAGMTDSFLGLMLPNAGDELQGIKRGLLELLDLIAVNKADGDNVRAAKRAARELESAAHFTRASRDGGPPPVFTCSAHTGDGLADIWDHIRSTYEHDVASGAAAERRRKQAIAWMWTMVDERLREMFRRNDAVASALPRIEQAVRTGDAPATRAAEELLTIFAHAQTDDATSGA